MRDSRGCFCPCRSVQQCPHTTLPLRSHQSHAAHCDAVIMRWWTGYRLLLSELCARDDIFSMLTAYSINTSLDLGHPRPQYTLHPTIRLALFFSFALPVIDLVWPPSWHSLSRHAKAVVSQSLSSPLLPISYEHFRPLLP